MYGIGAYHPGPWSCPYSPPYYVKYLAKNTRPARRSDPIRRDNSCMKRSTLENFYRNYCLYDEARRELATLYNTYQSPDLTTPRPAARTRNSDPVTAALHRIEKKRAEFERLQDKIFRDSDEIEAWICALDDFKLRAIIRERFLCGRTWQQTTYLVFRSKNPGTSRTCYRRGIESGKLVFDPEDPEE